MGIGSSVIEQEEIGKCTTPQITRILPKKLDPRSPTEGIIRTPIEVTCTPKTVDTQISTSNIAFDTPKSSKCASNFTTNENVKMLATNGAEQGTESVQSSEDEIFIDNVFRNVEDSIELNETKYCDISKNGIFTECAKNVDSVNADLKDSDYEIKTKEKLISKKPTYLETDIDAIGDHFLDNLHIEHPRVKQLRIIKETKKTIVGEAQNDITTDTTTEVLCSDSLSTRIDSMSFSDVPSFDDLSLMVSDNDDVSLSTSQNCVCKPAVQDWLITVEDGCDGLLPFDIPFNDCSKMSEMNDCENSLICGALKNVNVTPDNKRRNPLRGRTPLSCLVQNKISEPIKEGSSMKKKQWSGIQEERQRRGISLGDENTPPMPPPLDKISSAPGKLMIRRRNIVEWDQDNGSVLI